MIDIKNDQIVIEEKGIYSIEKFLLARRLMYWQVYLHKTVLSSEMMLIKLIQRALYLTNSNKKIYLSPEIDFFLKNKFSLKDLENDKIILDKFSKIDDYEIFTCLKYWTKEDDYVLSNLSKKILNRDLLKIKIQKDQFKQEMIENSINLMTKNENISKEEANYFIFSDKVSNSMYTDDDSDIKILFKDGKVDDFKKCSEQFDNNIINKTIKKYFFCSPNEYINS